MSEWTQTALGKLCKFQAGDAFPKDRQGLVVGEYPFIKVSDMNLPGNERFIQKSNNWIQKADASKYRLHPPGSVVFAKIGEALRANRRRVLVRETIIDNNMMSAVPKGDINPSFLLYVLEGIDFNDISRGSALPYLAAGDLNKLTVTIPGKAAQQAIAETLSLLDQKIELNRRMNETLEGMAQAIFRDWFVDFGPTRRKAAGEADPVAIMGGLTPDPTRAAELAALFPAAFGNDDLPLGWTETPIGDVVKIQGGSTPSTGDESLWSPGIHHWATPKDLSKMDNLALFRTSRQISDAGLAKITSGLLPVGAVLLSSRAPIGYMAIAQVPVAINQGFIGLLPTEEIGSAYLYLWCKANMDKITANANGSTFQEISKRNFRPITSAVPADRRIIAEFGEIATPLINRIVVSAKENQILAETRDYLLPRLMSGEVRIAPSDEERV